MTHIPTDWTDPSDDVVKACLTVKCGMGTCGAFPDEHCKSFDGTPLPHGKIVHSFRRDKLFKNDQEPT